MKFCKKYSKLISKIEIERANVRVCERESKKSQIFVHNHKMRKKITIGLNTHTHKIKSNLITLNTTI